VSLCCPSIIGASTGPSALVEALPTTIEPIKEGRYIHLLIAPTKQIDRIEWMFEKLVEMGAINEITFIKTKYTERSNLNNLRFQKIAISAIPFSHESPETEDIISGILITNPIIELTRIGNLYFS
jgi:16S rRNA U1498 N3-methylase RsmE